MTKPSSILRLDDSDPRVIQAREAEERLFNFYGMKSQNHFIFIPELGIRVRISEIGSGEPILIVPGNTGDGFPLIPLMAELKGRRLFVLNRPGGGLSEGMDHRTIAFRKLAILTLTSVMDAFSLAQVPIVAHSIGGHWSLWMAMDKPERVSKLTLLGVPGNIIHTGPPFALRLLSVPGLNSLLIKLIMPDSPEKSLKGLSFLGHSSKTIAGLPSSMSDCYFYFQKLPHYPISSTSLMEKTNRLWGFRPQIQITAEHLKNLSRPTMFLWGTHDPFGSVETGQHISSLIPTSTFHSVAGGGHLPWLDDPAGCGRLILDFISG
jgi:2-hydroxy-6-oxonona-2,4-dienedioate hydrolase